MKKIRSEIFNIAVKAGLSLGLFIVFLISWGVWQNKNSPKYKYFYLEYMDGKSSFYNRSVSDIEIKSHLNIIIIHNGEDNVYIPMHNLRFFGIADLPKEEVKK